MAMAHDGHLASLHNAKAHIDMKHGGCMSVSVSKSATMPYTYSCKSSTGGRQFLLRQFTPGALSKVYLHCGGGLINWPSCKQITCLWPTLGRGKTQYSAVSSTTLVGRLLIKRFTDFWQTPPPLLALNN